MKSSPANLKDLDGLKDLSADFKKESDANYNHTADNLETTSHIVDMIYKQDTPQSKQEKMEEYSPDNAPFVYKRDSAGVSTIHNSIENFKQ